MKKKLKAIFWIIVTIVPIAGIAISFIDPVGFIATQEIYREKIALFGVFGPIIFIVLQAAQVVFTPINHYVVGILGGFLYGPFLGGALNWVGRMIGHLIAFKISHKWGRKLVERYVSPDTVNTYDKYVSNQYGILFLIYFLPFFPDDEISYLAGLSRMEFTKFVITNAFGHIGGSFLLAYTGAGITGKDPFFWFLIVLTVGGFPFVYLLFKRQGKINSESQKCSN